MLIVDLNNFAMYPTAAVGLITAICRDAGKHVTVFSPLSAGVKGIARERPVSPWTRYKERLNFWTAQTDIKLIRRTRTWIGKNLRSQVSRSRGKVLREFVTALDGTRPQIVLISAYLMYKDLVEQMAAACAERGIPVLLGGPYFAQSSVNEKWVRIPGVSALAAGEVEMRIPEIVDLMLSRQDPSTVPGILTRNGSTGYRGTIAPPVSDLSNLPFPDYSDFPWSQYPERIVPVVTGRGCAWGACKFCSDVTSTAGRTFRSRPPNEVLAEIKHEHEKHDVDLFVFTDLKLNGNLEMWRGILDSMQTAAPGSRWVASVHCGGKGDTGLSRDELKAAADSGCVRLTTGLESGSQRMLDLMKKGTQIERLSEYFQHATEAGISARATMIASYPGERTQDVLNSASFVRDHHSAIERIKLCNFSLIIGTGIDRDRSRDSESLALDGLAPSESQARVDHHMIHTIENGYRGAMRELLDAVHEVNRKPLRSRAQVFEGVM